MLNILAAKRAGADDETIARAIAEIYNKDYDELAKQGVTPDTLIQASMELEGQDMSTWDSFIAGADAEVGSEITGIKQIFTDEIDAEDTAKENLARISSETNPIATGLGRFIGGIVNPSTLLPGSMVFKGAKGLVTAGAAGGAVAGGLRPIFVEEEELGRVGSAAVGAGAGAALGGLLGKLFGPKAVQVADDVQDVADPTKAAVEVGDAVAPVTEAVTEPPISEVDLGRFIEISRRIQMGEQVTPAELRFITDFNKTVEGLELTPEAKVAFGIQEKLAAGDMITPGESLLYRQFLNDTETPIFDLSKLKAKGEPAFKTPEQVAVEADINKANQKIAAQVEPTEGQKVARSVSLEEDAMRTGDYRDYFSKADWRLATITPKMFDRMVDPTNPFAKNNIKTLLAETEQNQELFSQVYGALGKNRMEFERQAGKKFQEIMDENLVPEEVSIKEILTRRIQSIIEPEAIAPALNYVSRKINDLHNLRELARVARERGSEDAYAVLSSEMTHVAGLLSSLEGNASNIGRALAFQKTIRQVVNANKELPAYLGGLGC